jgi:F-type H+-transporting ATPase subunit alpha
MDIALPDIKKFEMGLMEFVETRYPEILMDLVKKDGLTDELDTRLGDAISEFKADFIKKSEEV